MNSQTILQKLKNNCADESVDSLTSSFDVQTMATALKALCSKSCIICDELAFKLVDIFESPNIKQQPDDATSLQVSSLFASYLPSSPHRKTLRQLFQHLAAIAKCQPETMNAQNLARVFWPSLLHPLTKNIEALEQVTRMQVSAEAALVFVIENCDSLWDSDAV